MKAWLFQKPEHKKELGDKAPWHVGWYDPDGKRRKKLIGSKSKAEKFARKTEGQLAAGTYRDEGRKQWSKFRTEYEEQIAADMKPGTKNQTLIAVKHFQRLAKPHRLGSIKTATIDAYISLRRQEASKRCKGLLVSPATINKELRHLRSVLSVAHDWGYLPTVPKFRMVKESKKLPRYVSADHFKAIYQACDKATLPAGLPYPAADWWRAMLVFTYMTGWRVGEPLGLHRDDVDLDAGTAITRAEDNKGDRDDIVPLHPVVVEHLRRIVSFEAEMFPWPHHRRTLDVEFHKIQTAAKVHLACRFEGEPKHVHTVACHLYGFHDLRRAFATVNAEAMTADALQSLMRHKSYTTTQRYINLARQLNRAVETLHVPDVLRNKGTGTGSGA